MEALSKWTRYQGVYEKMFYDIVTPEGNYFHCWPNADTFHPEGYSGDPIPGEKVLCFKISEKQFDD